MVYDVIVVGAGPAGGESAYQLARNGNNVLILEKERLPRAKACGGGIPVRVCSCVDFDLRDTFERKMEGTYISFDSGPPIVSRQQSVGWMVKRDEFDFFIIKKALEAGSKLITNVKVTGITEAIDHYRVITSDKEYCARVVIAADGVNSVVAKSLGLRKNKRLAKALVTEVYPTTNRLAQQGNMTTFDFGTIRWGYAWIFPKRDHFSVGVFTIDPRLTGLKKHLQLFLERQQLDKNTSLSPFKGSSIPWGGTRERLSSGRVLLVGDAAGLVDPFLGEGIYYALKSANIAATITAKYLAGKLSDVNSYSETIFNEISSDFNAARLVSRLIYCLPSLSWRVFLKNEEIINSLTDLLRGRTNYSQLTRRIMLKVPRWLWRSIL